MNMANHAPWITKTGHFRLDLQSSPAVHKRPCSFPNFDSPHPAGASHPLSQPIQPAYHIPQKLSNVVRVGSRRQMRPTNGLPSWVCTFPPLLPLQTRKTRGASHSLTVWPRSFESICQELSPLSPSSLSAIHDLCYLFQRHMILSRPPLSIGKDIVGTCNQDRAKLPFLFLLHTRSPPECEQM